MSEDNKTIVRGYFEEVWNKGRLDRFEDYVAEDVVPHNPGPGPADAEAMKEAIGAFRLAFPNIHIASDDEMGVGDKVIVRWTLSGTHEGEFQGIPATGNDVAVSGITIMRVAGGKIAEYWLQSDSLGMMQQLGVIPS